MNISSALRWPQRPTPVPLGPFFIFPEAHPTADGAFHASVTVSNDKGQAEERRTYKYPQQYASPDVARLMALTLGWLHITQPI